MGEVARALLRGDRVLGELLDRDTERLCVARGFEHARDLLGRHRMDRVGLASLLQRFHGGLRIAQARVVDLRELEPERDLVHRGDDDVEAGPDRLGRELPAPGLLVEARLERARSDVVRILLEDLVDEARSPRGVDAREDLRRANAEAEDVDAVFGELCLVGERPGEGAVVADATGGALEAEDRATAPGLEPQDLLERARRAELIANELFPEDGDLLEVGDTAPGVARGLRGLRVELDQPADLAVEGLRRSGRHQAGELIEDLGVAGGRDPGRAEVS